MLVSRPRPKFNEVRIVSRPKGSKNKTTIAQQAPQAGGFNMGGSPAPASPVIETPIEPKVTILPTVEPTVKNQAIGKNTREMLFRVAPGQLSYYKSSSGNLLFKGRFTDENGLTWMTTMAMPLNPATGKTFPIDQVDLTTL